MIIEIPDNYLTHMREMPPQKRGGGRGNMMDYNLIRWIEKCKMNCVIMVMTYRMIAKRAEQLGMITYNPKTETWQGVDYGD